MTLQRQLHEIAGSHSQHSSIFAIVHITWKSGRQTILIVDYDPAHLETHAHHFLEQGEKTQRAPDPSSSSVFH